MRSEYPMAILQLKLTRNLRRNISRGHPWVYKEAVTLPRGIERAALAQLLDSKGDLAWGIYDPHSPLCFRVLSHDKSAPNHAFFERAFDRAIALRARIRTSETDSFRLFNGEGDRLSGLVCDVYGATAVLQFDGRGPSEFWDRKLIAERLLKEGFLKTVVEKKRRGPDKSHEEALELIDGKPYENELVIRENSAQFVVNLEKGQKTGFFLDQRDNRKYVREMSAGKSVLNLFSYSGGFSINAGLGGARRVASVDMSQGAIELAERNWRQNSLEPANHIGICADVFKFMTQPGEPWDHVIVDPPSMSHSESSRDLAKAKYIECFTLAAKRVAPKGELSLSSCSSHVSFEDFFEIINETLSASRRRGQILRISGQGADHPFPHACHELRYLKFVHLALD